MARANVEAFIYMSIYEAEVRCKRPDFSCGYRSQPPRQQ